MVMKKEIYSLNYLKGFCAILVVLIHTHIIGKFAFIPFYRCAVPIFFMISGYFLMGTNGEWHREKITRYLKKLSAIWIGTNLIYIIFSQCIFTEYATFHNSQDFLKNLCLEIIFGGQFCYPLWYITAYVWVLVILRFWKCKPCKKNYSLIGILLAFNLLLGTYSFILPIETTRISSIFSDNFLTSGLPFVMLGGFLKLYVENTKRTVAISFQILLLALCYIELAVLYFINSRNGDVFFTTPLLSAFIFIWFIRHPDFGKKSWMRIVGKEYSLSIYLLHVLVIWMVGTYSRWTGLNIRSYEFLIVLPITILACYLLTCIRRALLPPPVYETLTNKDRLSKRKFYNWFEFGMREVSSIALEESRTNYINKFVNHPTIAV